jgi:hypothetical protein
LRAAVILLLEQERDDLDANAAQFDQAR